MRARNEISMAATFRARLRPSEVPRAAAPTRFVSVRRTSSLTVPAVAGVFVSGRISLARRMLPGAVMSTEARRYRGSTWATKM